MEIHLMATFCFAVKSPRFLLGRCKMYYQTFVDCFSQHLDLSLKVIIIAASELGEREQSVRRA